MSTPAQDPVRYAREKYQYGAQAAILNNLLQKMAVAEDAVRNVGHPQIAHNLTEVERRLADELRRSGVPVFAVSNGGGWAETMMQHTARFMIGGKILGPEYDAMTEIILRQVQEVADTGAGVKRNANAAGAAYGHSPAPMGGGRSSDSLSFKQKLGLTIMGLGSVSSIVLAIFGGKKSQKGAKGTLLEEADRQIDEVRDILDETAPGSDLVLKKLGGNWTAMVRRSGKIVAQSESKNRFDAAEAAAREAMTKVGKWHEDEGERGGGEREASEVEVKAEEVPATVAKEPEVLPPESKPAA